MKRRAFLLSAAALPLCEPAAVLSPFASMGHSATIGVLAVGVPRPDAFLSTFRKGLAKTGFIEGQNIELVIQWRKAMRVGFPNWQPTSSLGKSM